MKIDTAAAGSHAGTTLARMFMEGQVPEVANADHEVGADDRAFLPTIQVGLTKQPWREHVRVVTAR